MAAFSQNGYPANDRTQVASIQVTTSGRTMTLRKGSAGAMLAHLVRWFDENIRDVDPGIYDDWSYAERPIRGSTTDLSNHASGTAVDVDATKWPLGVQPEAYLTAAEIARVRAQLRRYEGCIRWGGDYTGRKDPMHFEINRDQATCDRVWVKITAGESFMAALSDAAQIKLADQIDQIATVLGHAFDGDGNDAGNKIKKLATDLAPVERLGPDGKTIKVSLRQEIADIKSLLLAPGGLAADLAEAFRPMLLDAVQAGKSADAAATADEIVDELVTRLGNSA